MLTKAVVWLQFGYQDTTHQLPGGSARQGPDAASLLVRGLYGAGPMPSYSGQPAAEGGHLFQDLGLLALPREKAARMDPASTRPVHACSWCYCSLVHACVLMVQRCACTLLGV